MLTRMGGHVCLSWGRRGAREAAKRGDLLVIVDVLRFSSAVTTAAAHGGAVLVGSLLNAKATAAAAATTAAAEGGDVTVLACGERWRDTGKLRFALEDYLGAGAILSRLHADAGCNCSADAELCARAFEAAAPDLERLIRECPSGRELQELSKGDDVRHSARLDLYDVAVVMRDGLLSAPPSPSSPGA